MNVPSICASISENLSHNLRLAATEDERQQYLSIALQGIGEKVVPSLNLVMDEKGEGSQELNEARAAALDLSTIVCIEFVRKCSNHRWGVSCLEEATANCREPQLRKKLVIYTNQLKKKWNVDEPGGIAHNPRAKRLRLQGNGSNLLANVLRVTLLLGSAFYFFTHIDLTALIFPSWNEPRQSEPTQQQVQIDRQRNTAGQAGENGFPQSQTGTPTQSSEPPTGSFYSYTDEKGTVHIVDDLAKVPQNYRQSMTVTQPSVPRSSITPVVIKGNQVLVPVTLTFRGRSVEARFLLDTGASITTISENLASQLGVQSSDVRAGKATVADGRSVGSYVFWTDALTVGSHSVPHVQASILPGNGGDGYDGLLGMNFLRNFRYHIDFNRSVIEWGT